MDDIVSSYGLSKTKTGQNVIFSILIGFSVYMTMINIKRSFLSIIGKPLERVNHLVKCEMHSNGYQDIELRTFHCYTVSHWLVMMSNSVLGIWSYRKHKRTHCIHFHMHSHHTCRQNAHNKSYIPFSLSIYIWVSFCAPSFVYLHHIIIPFLISIFMNKSTFFFMIFLAIIQRRGARTMATNLTANQILISQSHLCMQSIWVEYTTTIGWCKNKTGNESNHTQLNGMSNLSRMGMSMKTLLYSNQFNVSGECCFLLLFEFR